MQLGKEIFLKRKEPGNVPGLVYGLPCGFCNSGFPVYKEDASVSLVGRPPMQMPDNEKSPERSSWGRKHCPYIGRTEVSQDDSIAESTPHIGTISKIVEMHITDPVNNFWREIHMAEVIEIGTLYFDGRPQKVGVKYNGERLSLGPTVPGKAIQWVKANGLLIADRCVCTQISWGELDFIGLVFGTIIQIDGRWYLCRCLKVGAEGGVPNEWDAILEKVGESNDLWHWKDAFFWGQETLGNLGNQAWGRAVRGGDTGPATGIAIFLRLGSRTSVFAPPLNL